MTALIGRRTKDVVPFSTDGKVITASAYKDAADAALPRW
jgi:hypothetical protein